MEGVMELVIVGGPGSWSPFALVSARLVLIVILVIDGLVCIAGDDGAHASMCVDRGSGCCRLSVVGVWSTSAFANAHPRSWVLMVCGCRRCGRSGLFGHYWWAVGRGR